MCVKEIRESKKSYYENHQRLLSTENANSKLFAILKATAKFKQMFHKNTYTSI